MMEALGRNPQEFKMYPTVWNYIGDLATFYIYDLIEDDRTKNRIQQMVKRLRKEDGNLQHDVSGILIEYAKSLHTVFNFIDIEYFFVKYIEGFIIDYQNQILDFPSYLSAEDAVHGYWEGHILTYYDVFKDEISKWIADYDFLIPSSYLEIFFPFIYGKESTPLNEGIKWLMNLNLLNKRQFAEIIAKSPDQIDSMVKKVQRWTKSEYIPNFISLIDDLSPIINSYPDINYRRGIYFTLYISIAMSRLYKKYLTQPLREEIRGIKTFTQVQLNEEFANKAKKQKIRQFAYTACVLNPLMDMLKEVKTEDGKIEDKLSMLESFVDEKQDQISNYHAEAFVYFIRARIFYMHNQYEDAVKNYQKAFELGRYRIGRQIKVLIFEFLHSCRKIENKQLFKRVHDWQSFIIEQKDFSHNMTLEVKTFDQVWNDFDHDFKTFILKNRKTGKIYS